MDHYTVQFVFDYCVVTAHCEADSAEAAPDLAWDWLGNSGVVADRSLVIDEIVTEA